MNTGSEKRQQYYASESLTKYISKISGFVDVRELLDFILTETRTFSEAEAGSIFLLDEDNTLRFYYVHNDFLFKSGEVDKSVYADISVPLDGSSISGFCGLSKKPINITDAYKIPLDHPFSFNRSFDEQTGYRTKSVLALPILSFDNHLTGVIQLINRRNKKNEVISFSEEDINSLMVILSYSSYEINKTVSSTGMLVKLMKLAELRDPKETGAHVKRVGNIAAEIFHKWATNKQILLDDIRYKKGIIKISAMFHDLGKVGISDSILKNSKKLNSQEYEIMKKHTILGASIFKNPVSASEKLAYTIALHHHQRPDGLGYPSVNINNEFRPLREGEIPIEALVVSLADVYDALRSPRSYKDSVSHEDVVAFINKQSGSQFDTEVVAAFNEIKDTVETIFQKYKEPDSL